jgi:hypothetical protein
MSFTDIVTTTSIVECNLRKMLRKLMPNKFRRYSLEDIPELKGCGIILCQGTIFLRIFGRYTHVALYCYHYVYESTDGVGVRRIPISEFLSEYVHSYNKFAIYRFRHDLNINDLNRVYNHLRGKAYERNGLEFIKSRAHLNTEEDDTSFFCSEFVARVLQKMGLLS